MTPDRPDPRRRDEPPLTTFRTATAFRAWLRTHHRTASELLVRCYKTHAAEQGLTYAQALDEALCYGWIDGVRRRVDTISFSVRFTPRSPRSIWSRVNVAHVERLIQDGRMARAGLAAFHAREERRTGLYSFEQPQAGLSPSLRQAFGANKEAWAYFQQQAPWYRRVSTFWVMSAKREETRQRRLATLIDCSARQTTLPQLTRRQPEPRRDPPPSGPRRSGVGKNRAPS